MRADETPDSPAEDHVQPRPLSFSSAAVAPRDSIAPPIDLEDVRRGVATLAESHAMEKADALTITRLFHDMESLLQHERHLRVREGHKLRAELERTQLTMELDRLARKRTVEDLQQIMPTPRRK